MAMAQQNQGGDQFDLYFKRADLDHDGRISGAEAVSFFQGSGLPKQVLAQIWMHADQNRIGFLNRQEFYNALKLVTVAQSKRELTPDIVKAAIYGPASSKIPAPQINLPPTAAIPPSQASASLALRPNASASPTMQTGLVAPTSSQNPGFRGQLPPNTNMNQQYFPSQGSQMIRAPQVMPAGSTARPPQGIPTMANLGAPVSLGAPTSFSMTSNLLGGRTGAASSTSTVQAPTMGISPSPSPVTQDPLASKIPEAKDVKPPVSGNGFASDSVFGGGVLSSIQQLSNQDPSRSANSASVAHSLDSLQSSFVKQPVSQSQHVQAPALTTPPALPAIPSAVSPGAGNSTSSQTRPPWPKMTPPGIQKYTTVFMEVDKDRDGKITGVEARNLFLSWRLPREILKQVWDLADQDSDSMLSLREFCVALYLMERYREGRSLPAALPNSILTDETLLRMTGLPNAPVGATCGFGPAHSQPSSQQVLPVAGLRPQMQRPSPHADNNVQFNVQKSDIPVPNGWQVNDRSVSEQDISQSSPESGVGENKVEKVEMVILDSREKLEFYRAKMQELVLYKSKCDNRLNEIIERASADKREADLLAKRFEEKYKQAAEVASKLTIEEATFREYQERKMELRQAIINMEQGGSADGILQVRADRIQSDLEELLKALSERCKRHGLEFKTMALIQLPRGWQPGIPAEAAIWDEEWDKFEDEGLVFGKDLNVDQQKAKDSTDPRSILYQEEPLSHDSGFSPDSSSNVYGKAEHFNRSEPGPDSESGFSHSEDDSGRSPADSPAHRGADERSLQGFSDIFARDSEGDSEFHRGFDDHGWGTFDSTDDVDSVWGFNPGSKDSGHDQHGDNFFESGGFGLSPVRTGGSPQAGDSAYNRRSPFTFADSVPGTPFSKSANSPRYSEAGDNYFDNYSRFDSLSMHETRFSPPRETFARFDSINSSKGEAFARFDSINSSRGEAFSRFDSTSSSRGEAFERFDTASSSRSINFDNSSRGFSFDDADPFGSSGPFKISTEAQTPRKGSEGWSSF
ncbi:putative calcium-binding protein [Drosera capensis]